MERLLALIETEKITNFQKLLRVLPVQVLRQEWLNVGGQLIPTATVKTLIRKVNKGTITSWEEIHAFYKHNGEIYEKEKRAHAYACLLESLRISPAKFTSNLFDSLLQQALRTREWMTRGIYESRAKDYENPFRTMVYENEKEMEKVLGKLKDNGFINQQKEDLLAFKKKIERVRKEFGFKN